MAAFSIVQFGMTKKLKQWNPAWFESALTAIADRQRVLPLLQAALADAMDPETMIRRKQIEIRLLAASSEADWGEAVACLIAAGADVHADQDMALRLAAQYGHASIVERLLIAGADPGAYTGRPLVMAASGGHEPVVERLLATGADVHANNDEALCWAATHGHLSVVERLLAAGADVRAMNAIALRFAAENGDLPIVERLLAVYPACECLDTVLRSAILGAHVPTVEYLLAAGADVHADNEIAMRIAMDRTGSYRDPAVMTILLAAGADAVEAWQMSARTRNVARALDTVAAAVPSEQRQKLTGLAAGWFPVMEAMVHAERRRDQRSGSLRGYGRCVIDSDNSAGQRFSDTPS